MTYIHYGTATQNWGTPNAFRHTLWSTLLTIALGRVFARQFMASHEMSPGSGDASDQAADAYNNNVGVSIGTSYRANGWTGLDWILVSTEVTNGTWWLAEHGGLAT